MTPPEPPAPTGWGWPIAAAIMAAAIALFSAFVAGRLG